MGGDTESIEKMTYSDDGRVIRNSWRLVLLDAGVLLDSQVLDIASTEDNVLVNLVRRRNFFIRSTFTAFRSE